MANGNGRVAGPRCVALVGPFASGKTTLLEAILARTGAVTRQGTIAEKNTVGDGSPEARAHQMSVEVNIAEADFMGDRITFVDCPGSIEFAFEAEGALVGRRSCGRRRGSRCEEDPRAAGHPEGARRQGDSAHPLPQQDRQGGRRRPRDARDAAIGERRPAGAPPYADHAAWHRHRLHRPRAGARLHLPRACAERSRRHERRGSRPAKSKPASPCWKSSPTTTIS